MTMDDVLIRTAAALLESCPRVNCLRIDWKQDFVKAMDGYLAPTEKGKDAIARDTVGFPIGEGKPPVYRRFPSLRRKRKASLHVESDSINHTPSSSRTQG